MALTVAAWARDGIPVSAAIASAAARTADRVNAHARMRKKARRMERLGSGIGISIDGSVWVSSKMLNNMGERKAFHDAAPVKASVMLYSYPSAPPPNTPALTLY